MRPWGAEILSHDDGAALLERLNSIGCLCFNHNGNVVLGQVLRAWIDPQDRRGKARVRFDDDPEADKYFRKVLRGSLKGVSLRARVLTIENVKRGAVSINGRFQGPCEVVTQWEVMEISIVSVPADASVGVGRSDDMTPADVPDSTLRGDEEMSEDQKTEAQRQAAIAAERQRISEITELCRGFDVDPKEYIEKGDSVESVLKALLDAELKKRGAAPLPPAPDKKSADGGDDESVRQAAVVAERARISEITELCRAFDVDPKGYVEKGTDVESVRKAVLDAEMKKRAPIPASASTSVTVGEEAVDKFRLAGQDALLLRAGVDVSQAKRGGGYVVHEGAASLAHMTMRELMAEYLRLRGKSDALRMSTDDLIRAALTPDSQFVGMLDNTVGKAMLIGFQAAATTYQAWTGRDSLGDFKPVKRYRLSEAAALRDMTQHAEFPFDQMSDEGISIQLATKGIKFGIARQAIINDDLAYITKMPAAYTRAALRGLNRAVYAILNGNPALTIDSKALFHADHGNYVALGGGAAVGKATLGIARKAMRRQKNIRSDEYINVSPLFLLAPPEIETDTETFLVSIADPEADHAGVANVFRNKLQLISDPELSDAYAWFLAADPRQTDTISVSYLDGRDMPTLESQASWDILGMEWRMFWDYTVDVLDYRGLYMNAGH